jgi:hypothetical protein
MIARLVFIKERFWKTQSSLEKIMLNIEDDLLLKAGKVELLQQVRQPLSQSNAYQ